MGDFLSCPVLSCQLSTCKLHKLLSATRIKTVRPQTTSRDSLASSPQPYFKALASGA